jgi:amino acid transporter
MSEKACGQDRGRLAAVPWQHPIMHNSDDGRTMPAALSLLSSERPRNVGWLQAAGLLFGDWGTSRLYVLGLAFFFAQRASIYLIALMSVLILAVGWAYSQICRIYPDGGGVYTAAKHRSRMLAVVGALLLFADYVVTASLSSLDAFRYFNLPQHTALFALNSPGLWAIVSIIVIGGFNLMGPKHTGSFAIAAAVGMVLITLLITFGALPQVSWSSLPHQIGGLHEKPTTMWVQFVSIVLALSGVEAIANLTGVMNRPVAKTARKAIWVVAFEVAIFNILLAVVMVASHKLHNSDGEKYKDDMLAFLSGAYLGPWAELCVRVLGGVLLLSATNTAITDMISVQYLMARDGELPQFLVSLNRFGVPWLPAVIASSVPILVLLVSHDLERLAALYAIGVIGAIAINVSLCAIHPRLRHMSRKIPMMILGVVLLAIWVTLAYTKHEALIFVAIVMVVGLSARKLNKWLMSRKGERPTLLRQAIMEQLTTEAMLKPKVLLGTYGSDALASAALRRAKSKGQTLVICFIREVSLSYKFDRRLTIDSDLAALRTFSRFLALAHQEGVTVLPTYDMGNNAVELIAESAAIYGCDEILIGSSRRGAFYRLVKGAFQERLEQMLPPDIRVQVLNTESTDSETAPASVVEEPPSRDDAK